MYEIPFSSILSFYPYEMPKGSCKFVLSWLKIFISTTELVWLNSMMGKFSHLALKMRLVLPCLLSLTPKPKLESQIFWVSYGSLTN